MKKRARLLPAFALILPLLSGCSGNLFMDWETYPEFNPGDAPSTDADAGDYLSALDANLQNPDNLSDDELLSVQSSLDSVYSVPGTFSPAVEQEAAIYSGYISISQNEQAEEFIANVAGNITDITDQLALGTPDPGAIIALLVPEESLNDPAVFASTINTLLAAADAYSSLGASISANGGAADLSDPYDVVGEPEDVAFMASISIVVDLVVNDLDPDPATAISTLYNIVTGTDTTTSISTATLDGLDTPGTDTYAILEWAGLSGLFQ